MDNFRVGEIAIVMADAPATVLKWEGCEVQIVGPLKPFIILGIHASDVHPCRCPDGDIWEIAVNYLRKKPPVKQMQELGEWELCPWRPAVQPTVTGKP